MQEYAKHIVQNGRLYLPLEEYPQEKKYIYIPCYILKLWTLRQLYATITLT